MQDFIISIGRGANDSENYLADNVWRYFQSALETSCRLGGRITFTEAGLSTSPSWGTEESFTVGLVSNHSLALVTDMMSILARAYGQDAIAVTVGQTYLVGPDGCT